MPEQADQPLPSVITSGERTRTLSRHLIEQTHSGITADRIEHVLSSWALRGIRTDSHGLSSLVYLAFVPGLNNMVRVAVTLDDEMIITAFQDAGATRNWLRGNRSYFARQYRDLEERDAGAL